MDTDESKAQQSSMTVPGFVQDTPPRSDIDEILRRKRKAREYKVRFAQSDGTRWRRKMGRALMRRLRLSRLASVQQHSFCCDLPAVPSGFEDSNSTLSTFAPSANAEPS